VILAGDIGGTKTLLQLSDGAGRVWREERLESGAFADLASLIEAFLGADAPPTAACLAVAGPVEGGPEGQRARLTNLPWQLDSQALSGRLGIPRLRLINDFQAVGYAIEGLAPGQLHTLQTGQAVAQAPRLVVGAGTGLGVCLLVWQGDHYRALPTEGGHIAFAAQDAEQARLAEVLQGRYGRVSAERVVSGGALPEVYAHLWGELGSGALAPVDTQSPAAAAEISRRARSGEDPAAAATLRLFVRAYGATAGDLALTCLPRGGVYLAGGVTPKLLDLLQQPPFLAAFHAKGRMRPILEALPLHAVLEERCGLLGAASVAGRLARSIA